MPMVGNGDLVPAFEAGAVVPDEKIIPKTASEALGWESKIDDDDGTVGANRQEEGGVAAEG